MNGEANSLGTEAIKTAAGVRTKVLRNTEIDGLITVFSDVELFLGTFPNDVNIHKAAVELTVATFDAIERAIGFFLRHGCRSLVILLGAES